MTSKKERWENYPIRMITGWAAEWCCLEVILDDKGNVIDFNESEDIIWFKHSRMPWSIDAGWYQNKKFVVNFLVDQANDTVGWHDCIVAREEVQTWTEMIECVEQWMLTPPVVSTVIK